MGHMPLIAKTVLSLLALLLLIIVVATPSLYVGDGEGPTSSLGVFKEEKADWSGIEKACSDIKTIHTVMKVGAIVGLLAVAIGLLVNLGGYFAKISMLSTVGMIFEVIQIVGTAALVATAFILYYSKFDCEGNGTYELKENASLGYGVYLSCGALVVIFINLCVGIGTKSDNNNNNQGQNYNSFDDGRNTQEMGYHQTV